MGDRLPRDLAELDEWLEEARDEGFMEGQIETAGAHAELWNAVVNWLEARSMISEPDELSGHTAQQLIDALNEHENNVIMAGRE